MNQKRVLLKLSGESLSKENGTGIDFDKMLEIASIIKEAISKF
jgi:uridylate kinase